MVSELADALRDVWRSGAPFEPGGEVDFEAFATALRRRCWTCPNYREQSHRLKSEIEKKQVRNADLVEQMTRLRNREGVPGLRALIWEMANAGPGRGGAYWATRLEALVRGDEPPVPKTPQEKREFSRAWDERYEREQAQHERT